MISEHLGRVLVVVPTYNEIENLPIIVKGIRSTIPDIDILVADDNSPDGTGVLADQLAKSDSQIRVLHRKVKAGLGAAYIEAFGWAKENNYNVVVEMDADGSHRPVDLVNVLDALKTADVALGSRWVRGGTVVNWPLSREILSRGGNIYTRLWLGIPIKDATGGFRAYKLSALEKINVAQVESQGYCFQVDMAWRAVQAGLKVVEVPITFVEREIGESKMSGDIVKEALIRVTQWGIERNLKRVSSLFRR